MRNHIVPEGSLSLIKTCESLPSLVGDLSSMGLTYECHTSCLHLPGHYEGSSPEYSSETLTEGGPLPPFRGGGASAWEVIPRLFLFAANKEANCEAAPPAGSLSVTHQGAGPHWSVTGSTCRSSPCPLLLPSGLPVPYAKAVCLVCIVFITCGCCNTLPPIG